MIGLVRHRVVGQRAHEAEVDVCAAGDDTASSGLGARREQRLGTGGLARRISGGGTRGAIALRRGIAGTWSRVTTVLRFSLELARRRRGSAT